MRKMDKSRFGIAGEGPVAPGAALMGPFVARFKAVGEVFQPGAGRGLLFAGSA
jgi:hypothetical protein